MTNEELEDAIVKVATEVSELAGLIWMTDSMIYSPITLRESLERVASNMQQVIFSIESVRTAQRLEGLIVRRESAD